MNPVPYRKQNFGWKIARSFWIAWTVIPFLNWVGFLYISINSKNRIWKITSAIYAVLSVVSLYMFNLAKEDEMGAIVLICSWAAGIIHAGFINKDYLIRLALLDEVVELVFDLMPPDYDKPLESYALTLDQVMRSKHWPNKDNSAKPAEPFTAVTTPKPNLFEKENIPKAPDVKVLEAPRAVELRIDMKLGFEKWAQSKETRIISHIAGNQELRTIVARAGLDTELFGNSLKTYCDKTRNEFFFWEKKSLNGKPSFRAPIIRNLS
jgi:hypothetical protein